MSIDDYNEQVKYIGSRIEELMGYINTSNNENTIKKFNNIIYRYKTEYKQLKINYPEYNI